jgi:murein DD-endopeptidase MepM/ murein hydrolase activator NlpD
MRYLFGFLSLFALGLVLLMQCGEANLCEGIDCNDNNECTEDVCNPVDGHCTNTALSEGTDCDLDGDPGQCMVGVCVGLCESVDCGDGNPCTDDVCSAADGSCNHAHAADGTACQFGEHSGQCSSGVCVGLCEGVDCDDQNPCTEDVCNLADGSCLNEHRPDGARCDFDGLPGVCRSGECEEAELCRGVDCSDYNDCTDDVCDPMNGTCSNPNKTEGATCQIDDNPGRCTEGRCVGLCEGVNCRDGNECTIDKCDPSNGSCLNPNKVDGTDCEIEGDPGQCQQGICTPAFEGNLRVVTTTTGPDPDPDGYLVTVVDSAWSQNVGTNAEVTFPGLTAGDHDVELTGTSANCSVTGANPRSVTVPEGETGEVTFAVECNAISFAFSRPFLGDFYLTNFFDHDLPFQGTDDNGYQATWWGERTRGIDGHNGYDWVMPEGTPLLAMADGEVLQALQIPPGSCPTGSKIVEVLHVLPNSEQVSSMYRHMSRIDVATGDQVRAGQQIGLSGNTGCSTEPHLHFTVWRYTSTNNGQPARIDPYGWEGPSADPWAEHPEGAESIRLWKDGEAPSIHRQFNLRPNPAPADNAPVAITAIRWMGYKDSENPNNEFVELTLDPRFSSGPDFDLTGFRLRNNNGDSFFFPDGFVIHENQPVRIYTGAGQNTATVLYWGRSGGVWDNMGDCAYLVRSIGSNMYRLTYGGGCQ